MTLTRPSLLRFIVLTCLFGFVLVVITSPSWRMLLTLWTESGSSYSHGPLVVAICIWLAFSQWGQLQSAAPAGKSQLLFALMTGFGASLIWTLGHMTSVSILQWLALPIIAAGLLIATSAQAVRVSTLAPCIGLYFALPVWALLVPMLQGLAVEAVSFAVHLLNIPAFIDGIEVSIPGGKFIVEGGCSGVRYLLVSLALTSLWSFLYLPKRKYAAALIGFAVILSILANWLRIFIIVAIGYKTQMQSSLMQDHEFFGWILFAFTLIPIFIFAIWSERRCQQEQHARTQQPENSPQWSGRSFILAVFLIGSLPLLAQVYLSTIKPQTAPNLRHQIQVPALGEPQTKMKNMVNLYSGQKRQVFGGWKPSFSGISQWHSAIYEPSELEVLVAHIEKQTKTAELFSETNSFQALNASYQWQQTLDGQTIQLRNLYNQQWIGQLLYQVGQTTTSSGIFGKLEQLKALLSGRNDARLIIFGFKCETDCAKERTLLKSINQQNFGQEILETVSTP